jgi:Flp pilus assembly protein TadD
MRDFRGTVVPTFVAVLLAIGCGAAAKQHKQIARESESLRGELAELYVSKGAREASIPLLQRIITEQPTNVRARVLYGSVLRDSGLFPQAETQLRAALMLDARRADAHAALAILLDLTGRHAQALSHHMRATKLAPGVADYRNNLGFSLLSAGEHAAAVRPLEAALALDPSLGQAYANLGFAYGYSGRFTEAERTFRAGLGEVATLLNLAMLHDERGDHAAAAALRERAHVLAPDKRPSTSELTR